MASFLVKMGGHLWKKTVASGRGRFSEIRRRSHRRSDFFPIFLWYLSGLFALSRFHPESPCFFREIQTTICPSWISGVWNVHHFQRVRVWTWKYGLEWLSSQRFNVVFLFAEKWNRTVVVFERKSHWPVAGSHRTVPPRSRPVWVAEVSLEKTMNTMKRALIGAVDQGSSSTRFLVQDIKLSRYQRTMADFVWCWKNKNSKNVECRAICRCFRPGTLNW